MAAAGALLSRLLLLGAAAFALIAPDVALVVCGFDRVVRDRKVFLLQSLINQGFEGRVPQADPPPRRPPPVLVAPPDDLESPKVGWLNAAVNNLGKLSESEQLLFRVLASTGMRLSECLSENILNPMNQL